MSVIYSFNEYKDKQLNTMFRVIINVNKANKQASALKVKLFPLLITDEDARNGAQLELEIPIIFLKSFSDFSWTKRETVYTCMYVYLDT